MVVGSAPDIDQLVWDLASIRCALEQPVTDAVAAELREREEAIVAVLRESGLLPAGRRTPPPAHRTSIAPQTWF